MKWRKEKEEVLKGGVGTCLPLLWVLISSESLSLSLSLPTSSSQEMVGNLPSEIVHFEKGNKIWGSLFYLLENNPEMQLVASLENYLQRLKMGKWSRQ